jgi:hypothetical protein
MHVENSAAIREKARAKSSRRDDCASEYAFLLVIRSKIVISCDLEDSIRTFLLTERCQTMLKVAAVFYAVGTCVVVAAWLLPGRPADQRLTFVALVGIALALSYMFAGLFLWISMFWFTVKYWPINTSLKVALGIAEIISFGWFVPLIVYLFAYRPYVRSIDSHIANQSAQLSP